MNSPRPKTGDVLLQAEGVSKRYRQGGRTLDILNNLDLKVEAGEIVALVGPSGSGKSSLLHILGLLDTPDAGQVMIARQSASHLPEAQRTQLRRLAIGFVYQFHHLLAEFTAAENVAMPLIIAGVRKKQAVAKAVELLEGFGLAERAEHRPAQLSGGEQQRVAMARALVHDPLVVLADEPTGNLDPETSAGVFDVLMRQVRLRGMAALVATHNLDLADQMDRVLELKAGKVRPL